MAEVIEIGDDLFGYLARPSTEAKAGVLVIHEVWGLTDHIKSVADRLAGEGYLALAPDLLTDTELDTSSLSGLQEALFDPERKNAIQPKFRELMAPANNPEFGAKVLAGARAAFDYLFDLPETKQRVAVIGFCFGGTYSFSLAVAEPRLKLALPFYGHSSNDIAALKSIACPVRAFYGHNDQGLAVQYDELPELMRQANVDYEQKVYSECGHAFFNDTNKFAYNRSAATDAWKRVLEELSKV